MCSKEFAIVQIMLLPRGAIGTAVARQNIDLMGALVITRLAQNSLAGLALCLAGCATLPSSGPTAGRIVKGAENSPENFPFDVLDLNPQAANELDKEAGQEGIAALLQLKGGGPTDRIGPGDILNVSIYEVGVSLFARTGQGEQAFDPSAHGEKFPAIVVDAQGAIRLPYVGTLVVAGMTPAAVADAINQRLRGQSQSPQAVVQVVGNITNTVFVSGTIKKPGKFDLSPRGERLLDLIAEAGGVEGDAEDVIVTVTRQGVSATQRLGSITAGTGNDISMQPGDRVQLARRPQTFTVFGAAGRVSQISFDTSKITLAEAIARAAGPSENAADPTAVFLFRQLPDQNDASKVRRVIYRLNMMEPFSYFVAQNFSMRDKDLIYVANARSNQAMKFVAAISQLFTPVLTVRALSN